MNGADHYRLRSDRIPVRRGEPLPVGVCTSILSSADKHLSRFYGRYPEYDPELHEPLKKPSDRVFNAWLKDYLEQLIQNIADDIEYAMTEIDGEMVIPIWRVITAPKDWTPDFKSEDVNGLGVYWSWDESAAEAHWAKSCTGCVKWRIGSVAMENQVDWNLTLALNANPSIGEDEKEIRLKAGTEIPILTLERSMDDLGHDFEDVPVDAYAGRKFAANPRSDR